MFEYSSFKNKKPCVCRKVPAPLRELGIVVLYIISTGNIFVGAPCSMSAEAFARPTSQGGSCPSSAMMRSYRVFPNWGQAFLANDL